MQEMTLKEYDAMVRRLEDYARSSPRANAVRVAALALMFYGYVFVLAGAVTAVFALGIWIITIRPKDIVSVAVFMYIPAGTIALVLWRSMLVRLDLPEGEQLEHTDAPGLFAMIQDVRAKIGAVPIEKVLLTPTYNASVNQIPENGLLGRHKNYLVLGLPLLMSLSTDELRAVIAHEFGHMAGGHSRFGNWIYRQRTSLQRLRFHQGEHSSVLFRPLFKHLLPYFNAYSFALARANEYVADQAASEVTDPSTMARALTGSRRRRMVRVRLLGGGTRTKHLGAGPAIGHLRGHTRLDDLRA